MSTKLKPEQKISPKNVVEHASGTHLSNSKRREEILPVASRVFARRGYRNTDVQEIADILGIGKGTIYRAFANKEELFLACVDDGMQRLSDTMREYSIKCEQSGLDLIDRFEHSILEFLSFFDKNEDLVELLMQERSEFRDRPTHSYHRHQMQNRERWHNNMAKAIDEGLLRQLPVDGVIEIINDTLYGAIFT
ncbi:MAG TPA: TetR/AcrR family transcriptional regulator, partial [Chroococcales cyanobacterium]